MSENNKGYTGPFAGHLKAFIDEKRTLGCKYIEEERLSYEFDRLSILYDSNNRLSSDLVDEFVRCKPNWQATTQKRHVSFIQNFGNYLLHHDVEAFRPGYTAIKKADVSFKPYIFTHDEIESIFTMADGIRPNCRNSHIFYPVLFRVLYGTGMRISEALKLRMSDVDFVGNTIHVTDPKNHKDRILPISDSVTEYCAWYVSKIHPVFHSDDLFFMSNRGAGDYSRNNVQVYFSSIIAKIDLPTRGYKGGGPHLHSLRHTFCVHSLAQLTRSGIPHGVALQLLCSYMGHQSLSATGRYLQLTAETFPELTDVMEQACSDIFPRIEPMKEVRMPYEE